ncbi:hypothetical protein FRC11_002901, partial [Ceratobasidium sp. 423]
LNLSILGGLGFYFRDLVKALSHIELGHQFEDYVPSWWKVNRHLLVTQYGMPAVVSVSHGIHYEHCMDTWLELAEILGLKSAIDAYKSLD